jgi:transcriptional regulator with XRE-family HTH domain
MRIDSNLTDAAVLSELGTRVAHMRLEQGLQQTELADLAGIGVATLQRLETGKEVRLTNFVRVLRALGLLDGLDAVIREPGPSPIELLKLRGRQRQRARSGRASNEARPSPPSRSWRWGDERGAGG